MNLKRISDWILRKLYPPRCIFCRCILKDGEKLHVCRECALTVEKVPDEHCPVCGRVTELGNAVCWYCSANKIPFKSHRSVYYYGDKAKNAIIWLKFKDKAHYAETMGQLMSVYSPKASRIDCVTFVPMTKKAVRKRGYNQSELLARSIAGNISSVCESCLEKTRETKAQRTLKFTQRQKNVAGVFKGLQNVKGRKILLVDDVYTTGATITEAAKALKRAGASEVNCITFAMTKERK